LTNIELNITDARSIHLDKLADKVLLDAPCLVLEFYADARIFATNDRPVILIHCFFAKTITDKCSRASSSWWSAVYSTCSIEPEENIENINWFLNAQPEFSGDDLSSYLPAPTLSNWLESW